jgi:DNA-binding PadR family transcriptional regulator
MAENKRSALGLTVLGILADGPMHAYRIQKLIKDLGKDRVVNVRHRAGIYQAIDRLLKFGLISVDGTAQTAGMPERTIYAITEAGSATARSWVAEMLAAVGEEFPDFPLGLSFLQLLTPAEAREQLQVRLDRVQAELADIAQALDDTTDVPRLFLLEEEYRRAVLTTERTWLSSVIADLDSHRITWSEEWLRQVAAAFNADKKDEPS